MPLQLELYDWSAGSSAVKGRSDGKRRYRSDGARGASRAEGGWLYMDGHGIQEIGGEITVSECRKLYLSVSSIEFLGRRARTMVS